MSNFIKKIEQIQNKGNDVEYLTNVMLVVEELIDADLANESLTRNEEHREAVKFCLEKLSGFEGTSLPVSDKFAEKFFYQLRFLRDTAFVMGI